MAGLTEAGFTVKLLTEILDEIRQSERDLINPGLNVSTTTPLGQLNGIYSEREALLWELLRFAFSAFDPDAAEGWLLDALCALTGTTRRSASRSLVACTVNLDAGATLPAFSTAHVTGQPLRLFRSRTEVVATTAGDYPVVFESVDLGEVPANAGTLEQIAGPVTGWNSVTNPADAVLGIPEDTDAVLRQRRNEELQLVGGSTPDAIRSDLLDLTGMISAHVFENVSETPDSDGIPPFSIEVMVFDGISPAIDNDVIAQTIWDSKGSVRTYGSASGTATDSEGNEQTVYFTRPTVRNVYITATVDTEGTTPGDGDDQLRDHLVATANEQFVQGGDVVALLMRCILLDTKETLGFDWVHDVPTLTLGFAASPAGTSNLAISIREIARLDTGRTNITLS